MAFIGADAGFLWAAYRAQRALSIVLPRSHEARDLNVDGRVVGLPIDGGGSVRFAFDIEQGVPDTGTFPRRVMLTRYIPKSDAVGAAGAVGAGAGAGAGASASAGASAVVGDGSAAMKPAFAFEPMQRCRLTVRLKRPHRNVNFHAPNGEASLLEHGFRATGVVRDRTPFVCTDASDGSWWQSVGRIVDHPIVAVEALRYRIRERIRTALGARVHAGIVVALAIGDQSAISDMDQQRFARTGTRHLIAVSGLHVSLVAGAIAALASLAWRRLPVIGRRAPLWLATPRVSAATGALAALAYAALAGMGVPALRAFVMCATAALGAITNRRPGASVVFAWAAGIVLVVDPWAVLSAGFWLSFGAVGAILLAGAAVSVKGTLNERKPEQREPDRGASNRGASKQGASNRGASKQGASKLGASKQGACNQGACNQGASNRGASNQGASNQGASEKCFSNRPVSVWRAFVESVASRRARVFDGLRSAARTQWAVTIALVPASICWFYSVPLLGPIANAIAIPWASLVVTPLTLIGAILPTPLDGYAWRLAHLNLAALMVCMDWLARPSFAMLWLRAPDSLVLVLAITGAIVMLLPVEWPLRRAGVLLWLPLAWPGDNRLPDRAFRVTILDVGQGTSMIVETRAHVLVVDTGPRYGLDGDAGRAIVIPALSSLGLRRIDRMIVSHADADHAGGALSIAETLDVASVRATLPPDHALWNHTPDRGSGFALDRASDGDTDGRTDRGTDRGTDRVTDRVTERAAEPALDRAPCVAGERWTWDGVNFEMLWPDDVRDASAARYRNAGSCVLKVSNGTLSALMPGDIEAAQERQLISLRAHALRADLLIAPHHGSRTSSTEAFLDSVAPRDAVFTVGYANRFGHPALSVESRYAARGVHLHRTDRDGAIRATTLGDRFVIERCRVAWHRYWMHDHVR